MRVRDIAWKIFGSGSWALPMGSILIALAFVPVAHAALSVLQRGYDPGLSGANLQETTLNTNNVAPNKFGLVFKLPTDDNVYAQPLYVPNVVIPGSGTHNVVYVATEHNDVYALDADSDAGTNAGVLWHVNLGPSAPTKDDVMTRP